MAFLTLEQVSAYAYRVARAAGDAHHDAQDLAQDVALELYESGATTTLVGRRARSRRIDRIRRAREIPVGIPEGGPPELELAGPDDDTPAVLTAVPLASLLETLPASQATALRLLYLEGRSWSDVQRELGITRGALGKDVERGIASLRRRFGQRYTGRLVPALR